LFRVFAHHGLIRRYVDAIELVIRHVAVEPLYFRAEFTKDST
jgi:hypothetical protein